MFGCLFNPNKAGAATKLSDALLECQECLRFAAAAVTIVHRFCESRSCLLGVLHHHCTWLPTCVLHNGCMGLFLLHVLVAWTPAHTSLLILCCPPIAAGISLWTFTTVTFSHFHWSEFKFFFLQEMIIDKVNGQPVPRYLIYDIIKFNVSSATKECIVALWDIQSPQVTVWLHSLSFDKAVFLDIGNFVGSVKIYIHL